MKVYLLFLFLTAFLIGCANTPTAERTSGALVPNSSTGLPLTEASASESEGLPLLEAIENAAEQIAAELPAGTRVAVVAFESESKNLSDFLMEELAGALHRSRIEIVNRQSLDYLYHELDFQMSGYVSDETAQFIGHFVGAEVLIEGQLRNLGTVQRLTTNAVYVERASSASISRIVVRNDQAFRDMVAALDKQPVIVQTASYGVTEQSKPQTAGTFLDRGILFAMRGDYEMAITDFSEAIRLNPNWVGAYMLRGRALFASVSSVRGVGDDFSGVDFVTAAGRQFAAGQMIVFDRATADFTQALRLDPNNALIYRERGNTYLSIGDLDHAIADFTQAIQLDPSAAMVYSNRGNAHYEKGDLESAIADYTQAIRLDPNAAVAFSNRGNAYYDKGDLDHAIADFTQAIQLAPNDAIVYNQRGIAYYNKKDFEQAIADFEASLRINPDYATARTNLELAQRGFP